MAPSPDIWLSAAMRLLDRAKQQSFFFERIAPGEDGPLWGERLTVEFRDTIYLGDFWCRCHAAWIRHSNLIVPEGALVVARAEGDAITVLHTVTEDWAL